SYGAPAAGAAQVFAIGSTAEDPQRAAAFVDWLYSPAGVYANSSQTMGAAGPQGLTWELNDEGKPELTEFGRKALLEGGATVPDEWGGGPYIDGASWLNVTTVLGNDVDPETGHPYNYKMWKTYQESVANPLTEDWAAQMGGHATTMEYLEANDMLLVGTGASYVAPEETAEVETIRNQVKAVIVEDSWKMAFAADEAEFESLLTSMRETALGLGYDTVLEVDVTNAKDQNAMREEDAARFGWTAPFAATSALRPCSDPVGDGPGRSWRLRPRLVGVTSGRAQGRVVARGKNAGLSRRDCARTSWEPSRSTAIATAVRPIAGIGRSTAETSQGPFVARSVGAIATTWTSSGQGTSSCEKVRPSMPRAGSWCTRTPSKRGPSRSCSRTKAVTASGAVGTSSTCASRPSSLQAIVYPSRARRA